MPTDTTEQSLERLICKFLTGYPCDPPSVGTVSEPTASYGGAGWSCGNFYDYNREYCVDLIQLTAFLQTTQSDTADTLALSENGPSRQTFLHRLQSEITKRGTIDVLRHGIRHGAHYFDLFYGTPSLGNEKAKERFELNRFTVTRQLRYSQDETQLALDIGLFINGLPVFTFELKNNLTKQTVSDAVKQYKNDRNPKEKLFKLGRCIAHFAVDEGEVQFCTHLDGKKSWFLPFNRGWNDGAGNPPNPNGIKTDYLWRDVLSRESLTNIIENYAQVVESKDDKSGKKRKTQTWPRYHQLDVVRELLADASENGSGRRYLIQHSAGSGKSNSIAWLAHQLIGLTKDEQTVFDSIIVVTDRRILDRQINDTIKQFAQVKSTLGHANKSGDLHKFIQDGKKIIISTVQKFPFILKEIGNEQVKGRFAIIIDEAHSSQGGRTSSAMSQVLSETGEAVEEETYEDQINRLMESHKLLPNASYFAFTATPKNKTLEIFGEPQPQPDGTVQHRAFHSYTMKQAIQEGFILDVLARITRHCAELLQTRQDGGRAIRNSTRRRPRRSCGASWRAATTRYASRLRSWWTTSANRCWTRIRSVGWHGLWSSPTKLNGRSSTTMPYRTTCRNSSVATRPLSPSQENTTTEMRRSARFHSTTYHRSKSQSGSGKILTAFLICADKFQTGYDEPLLHTMYVDKTLAGIKAVQTISRLNRSHPNKHDVFVLDFLNDTDTIQDAFSDFYRTTILSEETDPNKLHDLQADLDGAQIYSQDQIDEFVQKYLADVGLDQLLPILDKCVAEYLGELDEDGQVDFKGKAKAFLRTYAFLSSILPFNNSEWEKRSIFLNFLVSKLPAPDEDDFSRGILEAIDLESYRVEKKAMQKIMLPDEDAEIGPVPTKAVGPLPDTEMDRLSNIVNEFNELFGDTQWENEDRIIKQVSKQFPRAWPRTLRSKRSPELRQAERPIRARQCLATGNDFDDERRHPVVQEVCRRPAVQAMDE